jgi:hypothetical protein
MNVNMCSQNTGERQSICHPKTWEGVNQRQYAARKVNTRHQIYLNIGESQSRLRNYGNVMISSLDVYLNPVAFPSLLLVLIESIDH